MVVEAIPLRSVRFTDTARKQLAMLYHSGGKA
jgi:hypothetical protein